MTTRRERAKAPNVQLNKQLQAMQQAEQVKRQERDLNLWKSEVLTDLAKLIFAGVIIGGIFEHVDEPFLLYGAGVAGFAFCILLGYRYFKRGINKK